MLWCVLPDFIDTLNAKFIKILKTFKLGMWNKKGYTRG